MLKWLKAHKKGIKTVILLIVVYTLYKYVTSPNDTFQEFLYKAMAAGFIITVVLPVAVTYFKAKFFKELRTFTNEQNKAAKKVEEQKREIEYNQCVKPTYERTRNIFNALMKNGLLNHSQIIHIKRMLNQALTSKNVLQHYKKFYFKNDCHEIYVKLQNSHLTSTDLEELIDYMSSIGIKAGEN